MVFKYKVASINVIIDITVLEEGDLTMLDKILGIFRGFQRKNEILSTYRTTIQRL